MIAYEVTCYYRRFAASLWTYMNTTSLT